MDFSERIGKPRLTPEQTDELTRREDAAVIGRAWKERIKEAEAEMGGTKWATKGKGMPDDLTLRQAVGRIEACLFETFGRQHECSKSGEVPLGTNVVDALIMVATSRQIAAQTIADAIDRLTDARAKRGPVR